MRSRRFSNQQLSLHGAGCGIRLGHQSCGGVSRATFLPGWRLIEETSRKMQQAGHA